MFCKKGKPFKIFLTLLLQTSVHSFLMSFCHRYLRDSFVCSSFYKSSPWIGIGFIFFFLVSFAFPLPSGISMHIHIACESLQLVYVVRVKCTAWNRKNLKSHKQTGFTTIIETSAKKCIHNSLKWNILRLRTGW